MTKAELIPNDEVPDAEQVWSPSFELRRSFVLRPVLFVIRHCRYHFALGPRS